MKNQHTIKYRLREMRENNHLYQRQIAEYLNCTQQTYSRYETGELQPSLSVMERLSEFYNTSVDYLMYLTDDKTPHQRRGTPAGIASQKENKND